MQIILRRQHKLGTNHHVTVFWLPDGGDGFPARHQGLLQQDCRIRMQVHTDRKNCQVDRGTGWLGKIEMLKCLNQVLLTPIILAKAGYY